MNRSNAPVTIISRWVPRIDNKMVGKSVPREFGRCPNMSNLASHVKMIDLNLVGDQDMGGPCKKKDIHIFIFGITDTAKRKMKLKEENEETRLVRRLFKKYRGEMMRACVCRSEEGEGQYKQQGCLPFKKIFKV